MLSGIKGAEMDAVSSTYKGYPLIPEGENKCVWMKTGLVSYKLCDKNYHCDACPFDRAMRNGGSDAASESPMPQDEESLFYFTHAVEACFRRTSAKRAAAP